MIEGDWDAIGGIGVLHAGKHFPYGGDLIPLVATSIPCVFGVWGACVVKHGHPQFNLIEIHAYPVKRLDFSMWCHEILTHGSYRDVMLVVVLTWIFFFFNLE